MGCRYSGTPNASALSKMGQKKGSSRKRSRVRPLTIAPAAPARPRHGQAPRGLVGIGGGERRETREAVGVRGDRLRDAVVEGASDGHRAVGRDVFEPGLGRRENLDLDAARVHLGDPSGADVRQPCLERRGPAMHRVVGMDLRAEHRPQLGRQAMLLDGDRAHRAHSRTRCACEGGRAPALPRQATSPVCGAVASAASRSPACRWSRVRRPSGRGSEATDRRAAPPR